MFQHPRKDEWSLCLINFIKGSLKAVRVDAIELSIAHRAIGFEGSCFMIKCGPRKLCFGTG